jgi:hypothetical protein
MADLTVLPIKLFLPIPKTADHTAVKEIPRKNMEHMVTDAIKKLSVSLILPKSAAEVATEKAMEAQFNRYISTTTAGKVGKSWHKARLKISADFLRAKQAWEAQRNKRLAAEKSGNGKVAEKTGHAKQDKMPFEEVIKQIAAVEDATKKLVAAFPSILSRKIEAQRALYMSEILKAKSALAEKYLLEMQGIEKQYVAARDSANLEIAQAETQRIGW